MDWWPLGGEIPTAVVWKGFAGSRTTLRISPGNASTAKTEAILLHSQKIYEAMYGPSDLRTAVPVNTLCYVYDQWGKPEKSAPCHARMIEIGEKQFGTDSPYLVKDLAAEAQALRQLGRTEEATKLEQRTQTISAQSKPN